MNRKIFYIFIISILLAFPLAFSKLSQGDEAVTEGHAGKAEPQEIKRRDVDHPLWRGSVRGEAEDKMLEEFEHTIFKTSPEDPTSRRDIFRKYLDTLGVKRMVQLFEEKKPHCHGIVHELGYVIEEKVNDLKVSFLLCQDACTYACIHGVLKARFSSKPQDAANFSELSGTTVKRKLSPSAQNLKKEIIDLCRADSKLVKDFYRGNCAHAVGHAFAQIEKDIEGSETYCRIFEDPEMRFYCQTGVLMELRENMAVKLHKKSMSPWEKRQASIRFCLNHADWTSACMRFIPQGPPRLAKELHWIGSECDKSEGKRRRGCFNGLGFLSRFYIVRNPPEINRVCRFGDMTDQKLCMSGIFSIKKGHRWAQRLQMVCQRVRKNEFRGLCEKQLDHFYYKTGNPILKLMFIKA